MTGLAAVQTRVVELRSMIAALTPTAGATATVSSSSSSDFSAVLAAQLVPTASSGSSGSSASSSGSSALSPSVARSADLFDAATQRYGLPAGLLAAVAQVESGGDASAVSSAGAQGLMQLMPATARGLGVDALDPAQAVDGAARLLAGHLSDFGSLDLALAAYNAGPGAVRRHGGVPPYAETQRYVTKVTDLIPGSTA